VYTGLKPRDDIAAGGRMQVFIDRVPRPGLRRGAGRLAILDLYEGHLEVTAVQPVLGPLEHHRSVGQLRGDRTRWRYQLN